MVLSPAKAVGLKAAAKISVRLCNSCLSVRKTSEYMYVCILYVNLNWNWTSGCEVSQNRQVNCRVGYISFRVDSNKKKSLNYLFSSV